MVDAFKNIVVHGPPFSNHPAYEEKCQSNDEYFVVYQAYCHVLDHADRDFRVELRRLIPGSSAHQYGTLSYLLKVTASCASSFPSPEDIRSGSVSSLLRIHFVDSGFPGVVGYLLDTHCTSKGTTVCTIDLRLDGRGFSESEQVTKVFPRIERRISHADFVDLIESDCDFDSDHYSWNFHSTHSLYNRVGRSPTIPARRFYSEKRGIRKYMFLLFWYGMMTPRESIVSRYQRQTNEAMNIPVLAGIVQEIRSKSNTPIRRGRSCSTGRCN